MEKRLRKVVLSLLTLMMTVGMVALPTRVSAAGTIKDYTIYPKPQNIVYDDENTLTMSKDVNVIYDAGIDQATKDRTHEVMKIKGLSESTTQAIVDGKTNILVGINGSSGPVDQYFTDKDSTLFSKFDAYQLSIKDNVIAILGKDTDAAFMGVTTLKHIFNQVEDMDIRKLTIKDYAQIANRGFIEGYYGNPWSNEDRADLMTYGGDYKLNQYVYAPKDDPKHNSKWKTMYTNEELVGIKKAVDAGNESKCYYVYALHPFMADAIRFNTEENYQADLTIIKEKFTQLMEIGVKRFSILADDAGLPEGGSRHYVTLMTDIQNWLNTQKSTYEGLKSDLTFCPSDYYNNATSEEMQGLRTLPEGISVIQTGGTIWGSTDNSFLNTYETNMGGLHPFMWINWPCSDGTKDSLIMGGIERFLIPGANPEKMEGIILNPMMQSEANKSALFGVADYSWNVWQSQQEVDQNWHDSFNYMDHGTIEDTDASIALRELSKHMMNSNTGIPESKELAPKLNAFRSDFEAGKNITDKANELIVEFTKLKEAATYYKANPGNKRTRDQLNYWMNCWEDRMEAGINYLNAALAIQNKENNNTIWSYFAEAQASLEKSKTNEYWYINHYEKATIGRQHITPFIESLDKTLSNKVSSIVDPTKQIVTYITNRSDASASDQAKIFDNDPATEVVYKNPNSVEVGTYIGVNYTVKFNLKEVTFLTGTAGNANDTFSKAKIQYTEDGETWKDINDTIYSVPTSVTVKDLDLNVKGIRLIATEKKENTWLGVRDIIINPSQEAQLEKYTGTISLDKIRATYGTSTNAMIDNSLTTFTYLQEAEGDSSGYRDYIPVDATITLTFDQSKQLGKINFVQDKGSNKITDAVLEYTINGTDWIEIGTYNNTDTIDVNVSDSHINASAVRIRNKTLKLQSSSSTSGYWWNVHDFSVTEPVEQTVDTSTPMNPTFMKSDRLSIYSGTLDKLTDKNEGTDVEFKEGDPDKDQSIVGDYIGYDLGRLAYIGEVDIVVGGQRDAANKWVKYKLEYSRDNVNWTTYKEYTGVNSGKDTIHENLRGTVGRYVRLTNMELRAKWIIFSEFRVTESLEVPVEKFIYTNTDYALKTISLLESTELVFGEAITLNKDQYVGVKMERIKDLTSLESNLTNGTALTIQTSMNGIDFVDVTDLNTVKPSRYVRIINKTDNPITFNIDKFLVHSNEVVDPYLLDTTMTISSSYGSQDSRHNGAAFDNDVTTLTTFADYPLKDQYILYDLGQNRDIKTIRMYLQDTEKNYMRDAKFYVSEDKNTWTEVMNIGDGVENTTDGGSIAKDSGLYKADNTYPNKFYAESTGLKVKGKYLKIVFTAQCRNSFVSFNEIMINGGEYVSTVNDPTFESSVIEKRGFAPQNMFDGDLSTAYAPNTTEAGYIIYNISDNVDVKKFNIVQKGPITKAKVFVLVDSKKSRAKREWVQIGTLDKSLNELYNPFYDNIYALKVEWGANKVPQLSEIVIINDAGVLPDRTALQAYVDGLNVDNTKYTKSTYDEFKKQLDKANSVLNDNNSTQIQIGDALNNLTIGYTGLIEKGDLSLVKAKIAELEALIEVEYTVDSYKVLKDLLNEVKALLLDSGNITQSDANEMLNKLQNAQAGLVSAAPMAKQVLKDYITSNKFEELDGTLYLTKGFHTFKKALADALALVADNSSPTVTQCQNAYDHLKAARQALILKATESEVNNLVKLMSSYQANQYTPSSWSRFNIVLTATNEKIQENEMSSSDVATLRTTIIDAAKKLVVRGNKDSLNNAIKDAEGINGTLYTDKSNKNLQNTITAAKQLLKKGYELTQKEIDDMIHKLALAKQGLKERETIVVGNPLTQDSTHMTIVLGMGLLALSLGIILKKKKETNK